MAETTNKLVGKAYLTKQFKNYNSTVVAPQFVTLTEEADKKVEKKDGYDLSKNDFTDAYKDKLTNLENYSDTEANNSIDTNASAIAKLNGTVEQDGSVAKIANERIVALVAATKDEEGNLVEPDYDTLGKISTWIAGHVTSAEDMADAIDQNKADIKSLQDQQAAAAYTLEDEDLDFSDINDTDDEEDEGGES